MRHFTWDNAKNEKLQAERGISFEDAIFHIERGDVLEILNHRDQDRYFGQKIMVLQIDDYVYLVPHDYVGDTIVLRTIIPSRKMTKKYLSTEA